MAGEPEAAAPAPDVLGEVTAYLHHQISLGELNEWLARHTTWLLTAPRSDATELAGLVELNLAEIELGHAVEADLREAVGAFLAARSGRPAGEPLRRRSRRA